MPKRVLIRTKDGTEHHPTLGDNDCGVHSGDTPARWPTRRYHFLDQTCRRAARLAPDGGIS